MSRASMRAAWRTDLAAMTYRRCPESPSPSPCLRVRGAPRQQARRELAGWLRPGEVVALAERAALRDGEAPLLLGLDALEDRRGSKAVAHAYRPCDDRHRTGVPGDAFGQGAIDLDEVGMDFEQAAER